MAVEVRSVAPFEALVLLPSLGLYYCKHDSKVYVRRVYGSYAILEMSRVRETSDFYIHSVGSDGIVLKIDNFPRQLYLCMYDHGVFLTSLVRLQRRRRQYRLHVASEFHRSHWGAALPVDILKKITHAYFA